MKRVPIFRILASLFGLLACVAIALFLAQALDPALALAATASVPPDLAAIGTGALGALGAAPFFFIGDVASKHHADLLKRKEAKVSAYDTLVKAAETGGEGGKPRDFTPEEMTQLTAMRGEIEGLDKQIDVHASRAAMQRNAPEAKNPSRAQIIEEPGSFGFRNLADFALAVKATDPRGGGRMDARLVAMMQQAAPTGYHREQGSDEGYMVPPAFREGIANLIVDPFDLIGQVDSEPVQGNSVQFYKDESTPWGSSGVQANWIAEGNQMSASRLATKAAQLAVHKLYAFVLATDELLADAPRLNNRLTVKSAEAIKWKVNEAIIWGDGAGMPFGFMLSTGPRISVAIESGQSNYTFNATNAAKMLSRLLPEGIPRAIWLMNSELLPQLIGMTIGNQPVWTPPNAGLREAPGGFLLGRPIIFTEHAEGLGTVGDVMLVDPKGYYAAIRTGAAEFAQSMHLYFDYGMEAFRWTFRMGGQPHLSAAVDKAKTSGTMSHFVTLAEREA